MNLTTQLIMQLTQDWWKSITGSVRMSHPFKRLIKMIFLRRGRVWWVTDFSFIGIDVNTEDSLSTGLFGCNGHGETNGTQAPNGNAGWLSNFGRITHGAVTSGDAAADEAHLLQWRFGVDLLRQNITCLDGEWLFKIIGLSTLQTLISWTTVYSLNVETPMKWRISLPLQLKRDVPSPINPAHCHQLIPIISNQLPSELFWLNSIQYLRIWSGKGR